MKKIFTIILLFAGLNSFAQQINKDGWVSYWSDKADTLIQGDSSFVDFKYVPLSNFSSTDTLKIHLVNPYGPASGIEVFKINIQKLDSFPKQSDGTTRIWFKIPDNYYVGNSIIGITFCSTFPSIYVKSQKTTVIPVTTAIIDPLNPPSNIIIHYYNVNGIEIEKPNQGLFIWKSESGESGKAYIL